jgi:hypothetical protein
MTTRSLALAANVLLFGCGSAQIETPAETAEETSVVETDTGTVVTTEDTATSADSAPTDTGTSMDAVVDSAPDKVGVFVAQGHVARTMISCDDGRSWIKNRSDNDSVRCFEGGVDCDHMESAGRGIAFGNGQFVATFGWGKPGSIRRSTDGFNWTKTLEGTTFGGVVFGNDAFLAASRTPQVSLDFGKTWSKTAEPSVTVWNVRGAGFGGSNAVLAFEDSGNAQLALSNDNGKTWTKPTTWPSTCGKSIQSEGGIVYGKSTLLIVGGDGVACRSTDNGKTFTDSKMGGDVTSFAHFTGTDFVAWGRTDKNVMYKSSDGATWTVTPTTHAIGPSARSDKGTFVATNTGWLAWYEKQSFYRSTDGITWEALPKTAFTGSHPIRGMAFGLVDPAACK